MASCEVVLYIALIAFAIFQVKKHSFCTSDSFNLMLNRIDLSEDVHQESFVYSSLWNYRQVKGIYIRHSRSSFVQIILLLCGDIETCPGPTKIRCGTCSKPVKSNQSRAHCFKCQEIIHVKCIVQDESETLCQRCLLSNGVEDQAENRDDFGSVSEQRYELPELSELLSSRGLTILHQNIRGLIANKHNICQILDGFKHIHIFSLSETHLSADNEVEAQIPGYTFIGKPRTSGQGGGVGVYISTTVPYQRRLDLEQKDIECIWIEILFPKSKSFFIGIIYRPPDSSKYLPKNFNENFESMLMSVAAESKECIVTGDINCNYMVNSDHKEFKSLFTSFGLKQLISTPTRITKESKTLIDVIYSNDHQKINSVKVIPAGLSDHELIGCVRKLHNIKQQPKVIICRNYANYNPIVFCDDLKTANFQPVLSSLCVNRAWSYFKEIIDAFVNKHAPLIKKKVKGRICPWLTPDVKREMNIRDKLLRKARQSDREIDWSSYKRQRNRVTNLVKKCKNRYHQDLLKENANSPDKFWATIKKLYPTRSTESGVSSVLYVNGSKTADKSIIANGFCKYFSEVAKVLKSQSILFRDFIWSKPRCKITPSYRERFNFAEVSEREVHKELKNLKRKKATGIDNFPPGLIKDAAAILSKPLTHLINLSIKTGVVPTEWKIAKVIPLYKSGGLTDIDNYRPVSVLPIFSKILEKIIHKQLLNHFEMNGLLSNYQFGFRANRSTELAVTYFLDYIRKEADNGKLTGALFIDLSKAFDTISHSGLLSKLPSYGILGTELQWITDYLFLRKQIVQYHGVLSNPNPIFNGVPQGSIIGPLLFLIHFNDVHHSLHHTKVITYADDTVIFTSSKDFDEIEQNLNKDISNFSDWSRKNELIINLKVGKTEAMLFGTGKRLSLLHGRQLGVKINETIINCTTVYKYLGVYLDSSLNLETHFNKMCKKAAGRINLLRRIRGAIDASSAERIYRAMIMPVFTYCSSITLGLSETRKQTIRNIEQRGFNIITKSCPRMDLRIPLIESIVKKKACCLVFDCLHNNVCDIYKNVFKRKEHVFNTRNNHVSVELPKIRTEFGRKSFTFMAAKTFNELPLSARKLESRVLFRTFLDEHF